MDTAIEKAFKETGNFVFKEREALAQCRELAEEYNLNASSVARHYDAFAAVRDSSFDVSSGNIQAFKAFLAKDQAASKGKQASAAKPRVYVKSWEDPGDLPTPKRPATDAAKASLHGLSTPTAAAGSTPGAGRSPLQSTPGTATTFANRENRGQIVSSYNSSLAGMEAPGASRSRVLPSMQLLGEPLVVPGMRHLHMMDTVEGKVHAINERILDFGEALKRVLPEARDINSTSVAEVTQEPVWVAGRVVPESETGALNEQSVLLEGSREASSGARVKLDLSMLPTFRLFPGQVVCAQGLNPTGGAFVAQRLVTHVPRAKQPAAAGADSAARRLSMVVAAGPFTTSDNLRYEPLEELLKYCSGNKVDQVLLLGPFVDVEHASIKDGNLDVTFDQVFRDEVVRRLVAWTQQPDNQSCRVVLMPAVRDVHVAPVFPQPPMALEGAGAVGDRLLSLQSPCSFVSEGLAVSASSHDVLLHLSGTELSRGQGQDRMAALASHVIGQQSFYPLFPAPLGACLDMSHYSNVQLPATPDLLLLPSSLAPFAKLLPLGAAQLPGGSMQDVPGAPEASVVVNPGRLAKGKSGGTFAHVLLAPSGSGAEGNQPHQRLRVDIRKL